MSRAARLAGLGLALAATTAAADWSGKAERGAVLARGNTESDTVAAKFDTAYATGLWKHAFGASLLNAATDGVNTADRWELREQSDYTLSERSYLFGALRYEDDEFTDYEYQATASAGYGYKFIDTAATKLDGKGERRLAGAVSTADDGVAAELVLGLAPYHGGVLVVNRHCAKESTGHGSPLAPLVHGGPGRAGGGEELGGIRGVLHYMQRTAVQGSPDTLTAVGGRWVRGSTERDPGAHPFRKPFHALAVGDTYRSAEREVTVADIEAFAALSGDRFYAHMSERDGAAQSAVRRAGCARILPDLRGGRAVRGSGLWSGARQGKE